MKQSKVNRFNRLNERQLKISKLQRKAQKTIALYPLSITMSERNLDVKALKERAYDRKGWTYASCNMSTRPNDFDPGRQWLMFCCVKQCVYLIVPGIRNLDKDYDIKIV